MSIVIMVGQLLLGLSILVILHELGHFLAARAFGIKVEKFYLFFDAWGVSLVKFNYKGVEYGVGWLPLGGYVKIAGMIDESMDKEQMAGPPQPWEFRSKPAWQRLIVMLGGITVNIFVGIFIFWMLTIKYGDTYIPMSSAKYGIVPGSIGKKIGLKAGDQVISINGKPVKHFEELTNPKVFLDNTVLNIQRGTERLNITVPGDILNDISAKGQAGIEDFISMLPRSKFSVDSVIGNAKKAGLQKGDSITAVDGQKVVFFDQFRDKLDSNKNKKVILTVVRANNTMQLPIVVDKDGRVGFYRPIKELFPKEDTLNYSFFASLPVGASKAWTNFTNNAKGLKKIFTGKVKAQNAVSSPIGIAKLYGGYFDWYKFWSLTGFISMVLALMNLLPIPALDGGHAVFLIIEMIKGKPLSDKFLEKAQIVGFVLLIGLMVFAFGNDILKSFHK
ncbi:RIP metalloprotease RseP [Mucilaginibacter sp.]|uniref:RIP metalloprotease RseP n=1 Tax=Mucilaginibacter sp. TaxID=1882438 RepID=UPI002BBBC48F|nr:RIP metalloprotease RseP [Mucilaginibacter sp.]HTI57383.1 RIP metalloprotease RseP [Mucilaginibacter sp.]